jgi:hypothetical protein
MVMQIIGVTITLTGMATLVALWIWAILRMNRRRRIYYLSSAPTPGAKIRSGDRKLQMSYADARAVNSLQHFASLWEESRLANPPNRKSVLLSARPVLRKIQRTDSAVGLIWCTTVRFPELNRLAIWLLGRSGGTLGATAVIQFYRHPDVRIRRDVARALKRMRAWNELRQMAAIDSDPQVRRLATPPKQKEFATRLAALTAGGIAPARPSNSPTPMPLVWNVGPEVGRLPKAAWRIRQILERIHRLLHGAARSQ